MPPSPPFPSLRRLAWASLAARLFATLGILAFVPGCGDPSPPSTQDGTPPIAAANSYLECAARDLLRDPVEITRLAEPGMCPGHFDLRPSQARDLLRSRALLRFDFQASIDQQLGATSKTGPRIIAVPVPGGLCQPSSYLAACASLAPALAAEGLADPAALDLRLQHLRNRMSALLNRLQNSVREAGLNQLPVVTSAHQHAFCEDLGLRVVATFRATDTARLSEIEAVIAAAEPAGVRWVIANLPEGRGLADALAHRLGAQVVVFGNFPDPGPSEPAFDALLQSNLNRLVAAAAAK